MITADPEGAQNAIRSIWRAARMPGTAVSNLQLTGAGPLLPTSFHVAVAAQATIACAAHAAAEIGCARGQSAQRVTVDMHDAERECTGYFTVSGRTPESWAPLSGLYPCADGYVRIHANFDHHRDGALRLLGISGEPAAITKAQVIDALKGWKAVDFESKASAAGLVVSALRTFAQWDVHPHAYSIDEQPLFSIEKIGAADPVRLPSLAGGVQPLDGIRVLDLTRILAGPVCGRTLAAYGAEVMLVNSPGLPNIDHIADTSRGKRSVLLDLGEDSGRHQLNHLIDSSHIFVQGYRPGGLAARGFGPKDLAARRPGIIYVSLSAYGPHGPWSYRRGFDSLVQTATGFNHAEGKAAGSDKPRALPVQILDYASGFLMAFAAEAALYRQMIEGGSWHVQVSLAQTAHWLRSLGHVDDNFGPRDLALAEYAVSYPAGFGELKALPHAARFSSTPAQFRYPSSPPGSDEPIWMSS